MFPSAAEAVNPFPFYSRMRREAPVCFDENIGCWGVFRYEDVKRVAAEDGTFSRRPDLYAPSKSTDNLITKSLHYEDPPEHTLSRDLLLTAISPREQRKYEPLVRATIEETFDEALEKEQIDAVADLGEAIAVKIISAFLGIPESRHEDLRRWMHAVTLVEVATPNWRKTYIAREFVFEEISNYFLNLVRERVKEPREDFISRLLAARVRDEKFSEKKVAGNCTLLVLAMDVIKLFLANVVYTLLTHRDILDMVRSNPETIPSVVEECFRYLGPTHAITRVAARDLDIGGKPIKGGQMVYAWLASANHDETVFDHPDAFDHKRDIANHIAFSGGAHSCPGGPLSRIVTGAFISQFAQRVRNPALTDRPLKRLPNYIFFGFESLPFTAGNAKADRLPRNSNEKEGLSPALFSGLARTMSMSKVKVQPDVRPEVEALDPYKLGPSLEEMAEQLGIPKLRRFGHNQNPIGPSPKAVAAIKLALKNLNIYPDIHTHGLKRALAKHLKVSEENLVIGNGSNEIIKMAMDAFVQPGDEVVVGIPEYPPYRIEARRMGGKIVEVPLDGTHRYDLPALKRAMNDKTRMLVLTNPKYPTGTILKKGELEGFLNNIPRHVVVLLDECYRDFVDDKDYPNGIEYVLEGLPLISIRTLSKSYGLAGVRVGYGITSKTFVDYLHRVRPMYNVNALAEVAAIAALTDKEHYKKTQRLIWTEKRYFYKELKRLHVDYVPTQSNFLLFKVPDGDDSGFTRSLFPYGIMTVPGSWSGIPGWVPVTIRNHTDNAYFVKTLEKVLRKNGSE